jgi:methylmalonyl-CoA carboxyltransferase large subunit
MTFYGPLLLVMLVGGLLTGYFILRGQIRSEISELRRLVESAKAELVAEAAPVKAPVPVVATPVAKKQPKPEIIVPTTKSQPVKEEVTPEILAIIAAAVAQFVGAGARIRSTRMIPVPGGNAWAQQGRVIIQASHNLAMR